MAGERTLPGLGLYGFWTLGSNGYKDQMDSNMRVMSVLVQPKFLSFVASLPGSPTDGDVHILTATGDINKMVVRDNGAWVLLTPFVGWTAWSEAASKHYVFNGTTWVTQSSIIGLPALAGGGDANKTVRANGAGTAYVLSTVLELPALAGVGDAGKLVKVNGTGTAYEIGASGAGTIEVQDETSVITAAATKMNFAGAGVTVTDVMGVATVTIPGGGGGGGGGSLDTVSPFYGFMGRVNATQSIAGSTLTEITFGVEDYDSASAFASNRFTVPAEMNDRFMQFSANTRMSSALAYTLYIQRSTDGGATWVTVADNAIPSGGDGQIVTGAMQLTTGHKFRLAIFASSGLSVNNDTRVFFAGYIVSSGFQTIVREQKTANYTLVAGDFNGRKVIKMNLGTVLSVTVPPSLGVSESVQFVQTGLGQVSFVAGSGVTINSADGYLKLRAQYSSALLIPDPDTGANTYILVGDLAT